ncbi:MAG: hypothetical protein JOZ77_07930 [Candidatus Eremiobacteraeota bacterium]|nr:hypothetical protein [Candidatus Eremiobacteraeota bacterium]
MTINIAISVNEGLVMAADSLSQISAGGDVDSIHQSVEKITEIRARPIAVMINGLGEIDNRTIISLIREFEFHQYQEPAAPIRAWPVSALASNLYAFIGEKYDQAHPEKWPDLGVIVGGYSPGCFFPELYELNFAKKSLRMVIPSTQGKPTGEERIDYWGKCCALDRLYYGIDMRELIGALEIRRLTKRLIDMGRDPSEVSRKELNALLEQLHAEPSPEDEEFLDRILSVGPLMAMPARLRGMPLQEAVKFADYLGQAAIGYDRFCTGNPAVGGKLDVVAIQPDGLHWYRRKGFLKKMAYAREKAVMNDEREWMREMMGHAFRQMMGPTSNQLDKTKITELMELFGIKPPENSTEASPDTAVNGREEPGKS